MSELRETRTTKVQYHLFDVDTQYTISIQKKTYVMFKSQSTKFYKFYFLLFFFCIYVQYTYKCLFTYNML